MIEALQDIEMLGSMQRDGKPLNSDMERRVRYVVWKGVRLVSSGEGILTTGETQYRLAGGEMAEMPLPGADGTVALGLCLFVERRKGGGDWIPPSWGRNPFATK